MYPRGGGRGGGGGGGGGGAEGGGEGGGGFKSIISVLGFTRKSISMQYLSESAMLGTVLTNQEV